MKKGEKRTWAVNRVAGTLCTRCKEERWPFGAVQAPFVCQRCTAFLAGSKNVVDPVTGTLTGRSRGKPFVRAA